MLVEFASVVEAVCCAVEFQHAMVKRNTAVPQEKRIEFRIGINVGDVIIDGNDIFGDGVNVAARLEAIAEPGGIFVSRQAHDQIEGKLILRFRKLGPRDLKNIAKPVEVFAIDGIGKSEEALLDDTEPIQEIKYCRAFDGARPAYAIAGSGPILVRFW
jgi:class 3 adenylate cyclase